MNRRDVIKAMVPLPLVPFVIGGKPVDAKAVEVAPKKLLIFVRCDAVDRQAFQNWQWPDIQGHIIPIYGKTPMEEAVQVYHITDAGERSPTQK